MTESPKQIPPFGLRLPPDLKERVQEAAEEGRQSMNALIVSVLESRFPDTTIDPWKMSEELVAIYRDATREGGGKVIESLNERFLGAPAAWEVRYEHGKLLFTPRLKYELESQA